jgi:hypothetical protein
MARKQSPSLNEQESRDQSVAIYYEMYAAEGVGTAGFKPQPLHDDARLPRSAAILNTQAVSARSNWCLLHNLKPCGCDNPGSG